MHGGGGDGSPFDVWQRGHTYGRGELSQSNLASYHGCQRVGPGSFSLLLWLLATWSTSLEILPGACTLGRVGPQALLARRTLSPSSNVSEQPVPCMQQIVACSLPPVFETWQGCARGPPWFEK